MSLDNERPQTGSGGPGDVAYSNRTANSWVLPLIVLAIVLISFAVCR